MLIYKITNQINGKVYIGQTTFSLEKRIAWHKASVNTGQTHLYAAMRKYGWDAFVFEVIDDSATTKQQLDELEKKYIAEYNSIESGYNMTEGGDMNPMFCAESRSKHNVRMRSDDVRDRISRSMKNSYIERGGPTQEHRKHLSESKKALYASPQGERTRKKFRDSFHVSDKHRNALIEGRRKEVYCIDEDGVVVNKFNKVKEAAQWWLENGYIVKDCSQLCDKIKESFVKDKYIRGLKWIYVDTESGYRA